MKAILAVLNLSERQQARALLTGFTEILDPRNLDDTLKAASSASPPQLVVLDERMGDPSIVLDTLTVLHGPQNPPVILVLVNEASPGNDTWRAEAERLDSYGALGVEMFLHRPFGGAELKDKISLAVNWVKDLPPWVKLMRASRIMLKHQQAERILIGLESMARQMPNDINVAMLYARGLLACVPPRFETAGIVLKELDQRWPNSPPVLQALISVQASIGDEQGAAFSAVQLLACSPSEDNWARFNEVFASKVDSDAFDFDFLSRMLISIAGTDKRAHDLRGRLFKALALKARTSGDIARLIDQRKRIEGTSPHIQETLERTVEKSFELLAQSPQDKLCLGNCILLLEMLLDLEPTHPVYLERYVDLCLRSSDAPHADVRIRRARTSGAPTFELYLCSARVGLCLGDFDRAYREARAAKALLSDNFGRKRQMRSATDKQQYELKQLFDSIESKSHSRAA